VDPGLDDADPDAVCAWLHNRSGFSAALDGLAILAAGPSGDVSAAREALAHILAETSKGVQHKLAEYVASALADRALANEAEPLMEALDRSARAPESWCPFEFRSHYESELKDDAFLPMLLLRLGYPEHPGRTVCELCHAPAGPSLAHDLNCSALGNAYVTRRHTAVQKAFVTGVHNTHTPGVVVNDSPPLYKDHFTPKWVTTAASQTIVKADVSVALPPSNAHEGQEYLVDFVVTGPNQRNLAAARTTTGAMASAAEADKIAEVKAKYHVPVAADSKLAPFGVEVSGAFGPHARRLCGAVLDARSHAAINHGHDQGDDDQDVGAATSINEASQLRARTLWRLKAHVVAAVCRGNAAILRTYASRLHGDAV
jgi:hypothetical protein